ncbi:MAG: HAD-IB family hydrolase [Ilumatobacter sp.]|nr:HAD-IB family hydrolase [Ilumatobacter sp.]
MTGPDVGDRPGVAAFDVDGTLTRRDCVVPFLRMVGGTARLTAQLLAAPHRVAPMLARRDRDGLKEFAANAAFRGHDAVEVGALAQRFATDVAATWLRDDMVARLTQHRERGDVVVLVSASFELYLRPLADLLGGATVLGTRLAVDIDGRFTGELLGANCRGPEKVRRLHAWLDEHHGGRRAVHLSAYGDSPGDRELLLDADVAHWAGREGAPRWLVPERSS